MLTTEELAELRRALREVTIEEVVRWGGRLPYERKLISVLKKGHSAKRYRNPYTNQKKEKTLWRAYDFGHFYRAESFEEAERQWLKDRLLSHYLMNEKVPTPSRPATFASNIILFRKRCNQAAYQDMQA